MNGSFRQNSVKPSPKNFLGTQVSPKNTTRIRQNRARACKSNFSTNFAVEVESETKIGIKSIFAGIFAPT